MVSNKKIFKKALLKKSEKGNYYISFEEGEKKDVAIIKQSDVKNNLLYAALVPGSTYLANISLKNSGPNFVNQLILKKRLEAHCLLQEDGSVVLKVKDDERRMVLPKKLVKSHAYTLFHNSQIIVDFGCGEYGFYISNIEMISPSNYLNGYLTHIYKNSDSVKGSYRAKYFISKDTYLPVQICYSVFQKAGINQITGKAAIRAAIKIDNKNKTVDITLDFDPDKLLSAYNSPKAQLFFVAQKGKNKFHFETELIKGVSLSVYASREELHYFIKDASSINSKSTITAYLTCERVATRALLYKLPIGLSNYYAEKFLCVDTKVIKSKRATVLESTSAPYERIIIYEEALAEHGVYEIGLNNRLTVEVQRESATDDWRIISFTDNVLNKFDKQKIYMFNCCILSSWRYFNRRPQYLWGFDRNTINYAFANHCLAKVTHGNVELLLIIPAQVLVSKGIYALEAGRELKVQLRKIKFPVFKKIPTPILCVENIECIQCAKVNEEVEYTLVKFQNYEGEGRYVFISVESLEEVIFSDYNNFLKKIPNLKKYYYYVLTRQFRNKLYIKDFISARLK